MNLFNKRSKGFTLIELLIVIAILGILAAGILVAINPVEQLARARDAGRKNTVPQLGKAVEAYFISKNKYPTAATTWIQNIVDTGDIKSIPPTIAYSVSGTAACTISMVNNYCYKTGTTTTGTDAIVYTMLEANQNTTKCASTINGPGAFFLYSARWGTGIVCTGNNSIEPNIVDSSTDYVFQ